jgi:hypothetical protein
MVMEMSDTDSGEATGQTYCIECGTELPDSASFCPDCGAEVSEGSDSGENTSETESEHPDPETVAGNAKMNIKPEHLNQTRVPKMFLSGSRNEGQVMLYDEPLITYFDSDEKLEYLLKHPSKGFRITDPDGDERTPHHGGGQYKFLLITDSRVLYVAAYDGEDIVREFDYEDIADVKTKGALIASPTITIQTKDGAEYTFPHNRTNAAAFRLARAEDYIKEKIE